MQAPAYLYSFTTCLSLCPHLHLHSKLLLFIYSSLNMLWISCFPDLALVASSAFPHLYLAHLLGIQDVFPSYHNQPGWSIHSMRFHHLLPSAQHLHCVLSAFSTSKHSMNAYHMPGIVLCALHALSHLIFTGILWWDTTKPQRLNNLLMVTDPVSGGVRVKF